MKQHRSPLSIVNRKLKEVRIKRYHFERKIRGGVGITMAGVGVEPVIRAAKCGQVFQNECFPREALLLQQGDRVSHLLALIRLKSVRAHQQRHIPNHQDNEGSSERESHPRKKAALSYFVGRK